MKYLPQEKSSVYFCACLCAILNFYMIPCLSSESGRFQRFELKGWYKWQELMFMHTHSMHVWTLVVNYTMQWNNLERIQHVRDVDRWQLSIGEYFCSMQCSMHVWTLVVSYTIWNNLDVFSVLEMQIDDSYQLADVECYFKYGVVQWPSIAKREVRCGSKINPINIQCLMPALFNGSDPYCANLE